MSAKAGPPGFNLLMGAVGKSGRVLYAFSEFYLRFYGIPTTFLFEHFPVFGCISVAVYCVDESLESENPGVGGIGIDHLQDVLSRRIALNDHVFRLLQQAREYCAFEAGARAGRATFDLAEVLRITGIRSVDFRLMHHALLQIIGIPYDEDVFEWFRAFEMLMEIEDDLGSVDDDERKGGYNYYCFVRKIVGAQRAAEIVESLRTDLEEQLKWRGDALRRSGRGWCEDVMERYRGIVSRRPVPRDADGR